MPRGRIYKSPTKPMHLNLPEPVHAALMRWADASGIPASRFVSSLLLENLPVIESMVTALEDARKQRTEGLLALSEIADQHVASMLEGAAQTERGTTNGTP